MSKFRWPWQKQDEEPNAIGIVLDEQEDAHEIAQQFADEIGATVGLLRAHIVTLGGKQYIVPEEKWDDFVRRLNEQEVSE